MKFYFPFTLFACLPFFIFAQPTLSSTQIDRIRQICDQDVPLGAPGIACGIVSNGEVIFTEYAGYANLKDSVLISASSRFNIASNAKQYTALAILKLMDAGQLSLQDDIRKYLPDFYPDFKGELRIKHLLTHTSGMRDIYDLWGLQGYTWWKSSFDNNDALALLKQQQAFNFTPGQAYAYSNSNYVLLAAIIEKVSGQSFRTFTNALFQDLGMKDTAFESDYESIKDPVAYPYFNFQTWTTYDWIWEVVGDGNLFTTLADQLLWEQILQDASRKPTWRNLIEQSQKPIPGASIESYGYGVEFSEYHGKKSIFHHGSTGAMNATFLRLPDEHLAIITLSNSGKTSVVAQTHQIADYLFGFEGETPDFLLEPGEEGSFITESEIQGSYMNESGYVFQLEQREEGLFLIRWGRNDVELERVAPNIYQQVYDPTFKQEFVKSPDGSLSITLYHPSHRPYSLKKLMSDWEGVEVEARAGNYANEEIDVEISIEYLQGKEFQIQLGKKKAKGQMLAPDLMRVNSYLLHFEDDHFLLQGDRINRVKFMKKFN